MSWRVTLDYRGKSATYLTDELTLDEVEDIEKASGVAWALLNPATSLKQARAFLVVFALRDGLDEDAIEEWFAGMTLADIKDAFEFQLTDAHKKYLEAVEPLAPKEPRSKASRGGSKSNGKPS